MIRFFKRLLKTTMTQDTGDRTWGHLASTEHFGRPSTSQEDYRFVNLKDLNKPEYSECTQATHCMIFARNDKKTFGVYHPRAAVLMQMRFDGYIGFPGGLVDSGEDLLQALNRELKEEMNLDLSNHKVTEKDYILSHYSKSKRLCLHFYALETSLPELKKIEENSLHAKDFGSEVLGTIRPPLYTMGDGYRGFPLFLTNAFIGNSKQQLLYSLEKLNILTAQEIEAALTASPLLPPTNPTS